MQISGHLIRFFWKLGKITMNSTVLIFLCAILSTQTAFITDVSQIFEWIYIIQITIDNIYIDKLFVFYFNLQNLTAHDSISARKSERSVFANALPQRGDSRGRNGRYAYPCEIENTNLTCNGWFWIGVLSIFVFIFFLCYIVMLACKSND